MADQGSEGLLSPYLRRKRLEAAAPYLKGRVLDFGCGSGALASLVHVDQYFGVDIDPVSLQQASLRFPQHRFLLELPNSTDRFDSIVSLAVIEHVDDPVQFLRTLATYLKEDFMSRLVITTPHPSIDWFHKVGAAIGIFSKHASEEHNDLLNRVKLEIAGNQAGLKLFSYHRFLFGANQLAVFEKNNL